MTRPVFTPEAFAWLAAIERTPTAAFYMQNKAAFSEHVEQPLRGLMRRAALRLPAMLRARLETQRGVFSRFLKNDFGRGGAWANYWGAFYPKGSRRLEDVQLAVWMNAHRVGISFYIGGYGRAARQRFLDNTAALRPLLPRLLAGLVEEPRVLISRRGAERLDENGTLVAEHPITWEEWLDDPAGADFYVRAALSPRQAMEMPGDALEDLVVRLHSAYFPLALLAMESAPLPLIAAYLESER